MDFQPQIVDGEVKVSADLEDFAQDKADRFKRMEDDHLASLGDGELSGNNRHRIDAYNQKKWCQTEQAEQAEQ